ncbi:hypothetical protein REPUB_Repub10bG0034600 [Reevesia pubescens]
MEGELLDWEVLHNLNSDSDSNSIMVNSPELRNFEEIEGDTEGMIKTDYFSLDNQSMYAKEGDVSGEGSVESDNPSWIDPNLEIQYERNNSGNFWSDSGSDRSDDRKLSDFNVKKESGFAEEEGDIVFSDCMKKGAGLENSGELDDGNGSTKGLEGGGGNPIGNEGSSIDEMKLCVESVYEGDKKRVVWWKVPFELLRYSVFKISPVWSFSVAAAVIGFVILGHRLYKMKRKSRNLQLKVTMDDKKVSQFMTRAARLNEAFSVVRRVPIIWPSLPTTGVNPWPMMSLR